MTDDPMADGADERQRPFDHEEEAGDDLPHVDIGIAREEGERTERREPQGPQDQHDATGFCRTPTVSHGRDDSGGAREDQGRHHRTALIAGMLEDEVHREHPARDEARQDGREDGQRAESEPHAGATLQYKA
ncbi:MAG: hypothetical protein DMF86_17025 [Acidobacteria bacterium]|nr:MAG: hypothetical protein DMF86_17025 [Acidobacteriota bacterium]